jgi:hypothetical protein
MVLNPLEPDPVIDAVDAVSLVNKARDEVVVREVCIQHAPRGEYSLPQEQEGERKTHSCLDLRGNGSKSRWNALVHWLRGYVAQASFAAGAPKFYISKTSRLLVHVCSAYTAAQLK